MELERDDWKKKKKKKDKKDKNKVNEGKSIVSKAVIYNNSI